MIVMMPWLLLDRGCMCRSFRGFNRVGFLLSLCTLEITAQGGYLVIALHGIARG